MRAALRAVASVATVVWFGVRRVAGIVAPVIRVVSPMGRLVLVGAVISGVVGFVLGWQEFVYLALTLLAGLVVATAFLVGRGSFRVLIELTPRRVTAGERALGRMEVTNSGVRRSTPTRMELPVGAGVAEFVIPSLASEGYHEELYAVPTQRRAVIVAGPAVSVRGDQLGLLRRAIRWTDQVELFVHPRTVRLQPSAQGLVKDLEGQVTKTITSNDISFHALRPYEAGDDRRYVHWRTSARTGQLMVRQFEETRRSQAILVFCSDRALYASDDEFELAVSMTASLGAQILRDGTHLDVVSEGQPMRTISVTALLDDSCRLAPSTSPYRSMRDFVRAATLRLAPASVAIVVAGSLVAEADLRAVQRLFGIDTQTIAFRAAIGVDPDLSLLGDLRVGTVGTLDDLKRLVRRMT